MSGVKQSRIWKVVVSRDRVFVAPHAAEELLYCNLVFADRVIILLTVDMLSLEVLQYSAVS